VEIMPQKPHIHLFDERKYVVVVCPNNCNRQKTQAIGDKLRNNLLQCLPKRMFGIQHREFYIEHHKGYDYRKNAVTEGFYAGFGERHGNLKMK
jgi:hypothetical protein